MRAFTYFVSALALAASLSQATPLVADTPQFAQLEAELDLEAGLPITKPIAEELAAKVKVVLKLATEGAPFTSKQVEGGHWKDDSSAEYGSKWVDTVNTERTSSLPGS